MAIQNPFSDNAVLGEAWEEGYLAGFAEPEVDHLRPFAPDILDAYRQGEQSGRDERRQLPPDAGGVPGEGGESLLDVLKEVAKEVGLHAVGHFVFEFIFDKVPKDPKLPVVPTRPIGGLIFLVLSVIEIQTDSPIGPLEDDWEGPADQPGDTFVAVCPRDDHALALQGATNEGYWAGQGQQFFGDALSDVLAHGHAEALVARCSVPDGECGAVWVGPGK